MQGLGFQKSQANWMGRPPYAPADLLKLYLCGYLNAIRTCRALERECKRNVEVMWLLGRLTPDHKTIANFRSQNSEALVAVYAAFIQFARREQLKAMDEVGWISYVAPSRAINSQAGGNMFDRTRFSDDQAQASFKA